MVCSSCQQATSDAAQSYTRAITWWTRPGVKTPSRLPQPMLPSASRRRTVPRALRSSACFPTSFIPRFLRRHQFLPCASPLSDVESSSASDDNSEPHCRCSGTTRRISYPPRPIAAAQRRYSFSRQWFCGTDMRERMCASLLRRGWNLGYPNSPSIELTERNVVAVISDLFDASSDAALAFYFFRLSRRVIGSEHGLTAVCAMVHVAVSGNMNHIALNLLRGIVSDARDESSEEGHALVFNILRETSRGRKDLETVYSMLIKCYVDNRMVAVAVKLVGAMRYIGLFPSIWVFNSLIRMLLESNQLDLAWEVFAEMPSSLFNWKETTLSLFISKLVAHGDFNCACKLLIEMLKHGGQADIVVYTVVIDSLGKWGFLRQATVLLFKMIQAGIPPDDIVLSSIVDSYCKAGRLMEAIRLLKALNGIPDAFIYNSFLTELCRNGDMVEAEELFNEMFELVLEPDSFNYTTVVDGYCRIYEVELALKTFALMVKRGIRPTVLTYTVLLEGYCSRNDLGGADFVLSMMKIEGVQPDIITYNTLMNGYSKKGHMHKAYELKDMMEKDGIHADVVTYNILLHGLVKRGFITQSREVFNELVRRGFSPDKITYTNVIDGCSKDGNLEEAFLIWCSMSNNGIKPDVVTSSALLNCFCKRQQMQDASILFQKMLDSGLEPDLVLYNTLICGFCKEGNISEVGRLLIMMKGNGFLPNYITYNALVRCFEKIGVQSAEANASVKLEQIFFSNGSVLDDV